MHDIHTDSSSIVKAALVAVAAGIILRLGIFVNNMYYPDIGMPSILIVPALGMLVIGVITYLFSKSS